MLAGGMIACVGAAFGAVFVSATQGSRMPINAGLVLGSLLLVMFPAALFVTGLWLFIINDRRHRRRHDFDARRRRYPGEPWRWRSDWDSRFIQEEGVSREQTGLLGLFFLVWIVAVTMISVLIPFSLTPGRNVGILTWWPVALLIITALIAIRLSRSTLRRLFRKNISRLHLEPAVGRLGNTLRGTLLFRPGTELSPGLSVRLRNLMIAANPGGMPQWTEVELARASCPVEIAADARGPDGIEFQFTLSVPADGQETEPAPSQDYFYPITGRHYWILELIPEGGSRAPLVRFEIPVFQSAPITG